jgi:hypothetical protein
MITQKIRIKTRRIGEILSIIDVSISKQIRSVDDIRDLPKETLNIIIELLSNELCRKGLNPNDEPNKDGLEIENLIDFCLEDK